MSPNSCVKSQKRAKSVEGLLESSTAEPDLQVQAEAPMKKAKSLEEYLDACDNEDDTNSLVSVSVSDRTKKRNFVDKCINKMKAFMTATKKTVTDSK